MNNEQSNLISPRNIRREIFYISILMKRVHLILVLCIWKREKSFPWRSTLSILLPSCLEMIYENWFLLFAKVEVVIFSARRWKKIRCLFWIIFFLGDFPRWIIANNVLNIPVPPEPIWCLDRRESGHLFWRREASKVKFRCEVEVLEFVKDPSEDELILVNGDLNNTFRIETISHPIVVCATCICAIAVTVLLPWFLIGSS